MNAGDKIIELALEHIGEQYVWGARAPMANPEWQGPWDCAEFVSWCVYQATGILYGVEPRTNPILADAYTGFWYDQAELDGQLFSVVDAARIKGAVIIRRPSSLYTGHVVISDGEGGTIEAMSKNTGVVKHHLTERRWDAGILPPGIEFYMEEKKVELVFDTELYRVTEPMMRGEKIENIQKELNFRGYLPGSIDGIYGPQTASAVREFQWDNDLVPDGEAGVKTLKAMGILDD